MPFSVAAETPVTIDAFGMWTLQKLGYGDVELPGDLQKAAPVVFKLPPGATQGPTGWYLVHLKGSIDFSSHTGAGKAYVSASTNGRAAAQIKFDISPGTPPVVTWSSVDVVNGRIETVTRAASVQFSMANYVQLTGIQPGLNTLTFDLETFGDAHVLELTILGASGIEYTPAAPPRLALDLRLPDGRIAPGQAFSIRYTLANVGGGPARNVNIGVVYPSASFQALGATEHQHAEIDSKVIGEFSLKGKEEGVFRIFVRVTSGSNQPIGEINATVDSVPYEARGPGQMRLLWISAGVMLFGVGSVSLLRRLARNRRVQG